MATKKLTGRIANLGKFAWPASKTKSIGTAVKTPTRKSAKQVAKEMMKKGY